MVFSDTLTLQTIHSWVEEKKRLLIEIYLKKGNYIHYNFYIWTSDLFNITLSHSFFFSSNKTVDNFSFPASLSISLTAMTFKITYF